MSRLVRRAADAIRLVREGHADLVLQSVRTRLRSDTSSLGLRRDLSIEFPAPAAKVPLDVRPLQPGESLHFLSPQVNARSGDDAFTIVKQRQLLDAGVGTCWIAVTADGKPCYMQHLISHRDGGLARALWGDLFPPLRDGEALLEGAFTPEAYRGQGIMAHAMARIAASAAGTGSRQVITFVATDNVASLKGCKKAGFVPYVHRLEVWRYGHRRMVFEPLPEGTPYPFDQATDAAPAVTAHR